jgi:sucrose phosphorylase
MLSQTAPWVRLVTETNVPHNENTTYFGNGRNEAHMIYNFALPPLLVHTLQTGSASCLTDWAAGLDTPSKEAAFFNFTASHDGIGLLGVKNVLSDEQINDMCELVQKRGGRLSMRTNAEGKESVYEMNIGYFNAVTEPKAFLKDRVDQFMCSQAIALSLKGVPGIYLHSLLGYANWEEGVRITGHNRAINREKLQLDDVEQELADPASRCRQVFDRYIRLLKVRSEEPAFSPKASQKIRKRYGPKVFAVERKLITKGARVLALHNVSSDVVILDVSGRWLDLVSGAVYEHEVRLAPYQVAWLKRMFPRKRDRLKRRARSIANTRSKVRKLVNRSLAPFS